MGERRKSGKMRINIFLVEIKDRVGWPTVIGVEMVFWILSLFESRIRWVGWSRWVGGGKFLFCKCRKCPYLKLSKYPIFPFSRSTNSEIYIYCHFELWVQIFQKFGAVSGTNEGYDKICKKIQRFESLL